MTHPLLKKAALEGPCMDWNKITKIAHNVWAIEDSDDGPVVIKKDDESSDASEEETFENLEEEILPGGLVLLFMGGEKIPATVLARWDDDSLSLVTNDGYVDGIDSRWVVKAAGAPAISMNISPTDETTDQLERLMSSRGIAAVQLSPHTILELAPHGDGVDVKLWHISTQVAHHGVYKNMAEVTKELGLKGWYSETSAPSKNIRR